MAPLFRLYEIDGYAGTQVAYDGETYKVLGKACKDEEKVCRIEKHFADKPFRVTEAYSDSKEDILDMAEKAFLLKEEKIKHYPK